ncbi:hypothetical protein BEWA_038880 [Theileria equi strain WA]|uniref:Uncharacterized protein n=1 Tax=Theileria equi strain WA TaxID=1537102 RepID=L1LF35_THEEQ|nr:hypothetical protein BEWA_038880 [Theileria equi strain WA]EKX73850.1 hypothetical protein BEWA_038880 [Theileria equi strain WA]|eukprot:XP_004833302.1 hypothetical protein BEWA_038880 [Theileria equi strain WA]
MHTASLDLNFGQESQGISYGSSMDSWSGSVPSVTSSAHPGIKSRLSSVGNATSSTGAFGNTMWSNTQQSGPLTSPFASSSQTSVPFTQTNSLITDSSIGSNLAGGYNSPVVGPQGGAHNIFIAPEPEDKSEAYLDGSGAVTMDFISSPLDKQGFSMGKLSVGTELCSGIEQSCIMHDWLGIVDAISVHV